MFQKSSLLFVEKYNKLFSLRFLAYDVFLAYKGKYYGLDTKLIGFPSIKFFILSARMESKRCLVSSPFHPM